MTRKRLGVAAMALAGVLVGGWLAWPQTERPPQPVPVRATPPPERLWQPAPSPTEDTGAPPQAVAPPQPLALPINGPMDLPVDRTMVDALPSGFVACPIIGGDVASIQVLPRADAILMGAAIEADMTSRAGGISFGPLPSRLDGQDIHFQAPLDLSSVQIVGTTTNGASFDMVREVLWGPEGGLCDRPLEFEPSIRLELSGVVRNTLPDEQVFVDLCDRNRTISDPGGAFSGLVFMTPGPCILRARRSDGALSAFSDVVELQVDRDTVVTGIELNLPDHDVGGMGAQVAPNVRGVLLVDIRDNSPAARAGIENGEIVVAVDGEPLEGLALDDKIATITGPVDSSTVLTVVDQGGQEREVELVRGWIED